MGCKLVTVHSVHCCLGSIPTKLGEGLNDHAPQRQSVFDRLSKTTKRKKSLKKNPSKDSEFCVASINMTSRGKPRPRRRQGVVIAPEDSSDSDYSPGLSQILINRDGAFQGTRSRVAIPFDYGQSITGSPSPGSLRSIFQ